MDFEAIRKIQDEAEQINQTYRLFNERARLSRSPSARVEFITTARYIEQYIRPGMRVLDIGAGAGAYSLYLAEKGYAVDALELADSNIAAFRERIRPELQIDLRQGNAVDLSAYGDARYDVVLLMGPLYHLHSPADRERCLSEAKRVLKPNGKLLAAFINHDMVFMTELGYDPDYFISGDFDPETMRLHDFPFVFFTVPECRAMLETAGLRVLKAVAADGASELMADRIDKMDEVSYARYLKYHFYRCEKPELLGFSNHLLFVCEKG